MDESALSCKVGSFPVSTPSFFSHVVKKSGREPGQIRHVKCVISAGRVRGFVECSDLTALHIHAESQLKVFVQA